MNTTFLILLERFAKWSLLFVWSMICDIIGLCFAIVRTMVKGFIVWTRICTTITVELLTILVGYIQGLVDIDCTYWRYNQSIGD